MTSQQNTGAAGEQLACRWLEERGYRILHRNWRHGRDELDIIAQEGDLLVVVEVKTLSSDRWSDPEVRVDRAKQRKLMRAAEAFAHEHAGDLELRFDVIGITLTPGKPHVLHVKEAFYPTLDEQA
jgi:putative endonuclease